MRARTACLLCVVLVSGVTVASPKVSVAQDPPLGWQHNPATDHYYERVDTALWEDAEAYAVSIGGHLVTINDQAEQDWLAATFLDPNLWIGMNDREEEGSWVWSSGEPVTYTNWTWGEPNNCTFCGPPDGTGPLPQGEDVGVMNWTDPWGTVGWNDLADIGVASGIIEVALTEFLDSMVANGQLPSPRVADRIAVLAERAPLKALTTYLSGLVRGGKITPETREQILAMVG